MANFTKSSRWNKHRIKKTGKWKIDVGKRLEKFGEFFQKEEQIHCWWMKLAEERDSIWEEENDDSEENH